MNQRRRCIEDMQTLSAIKRHNNNTCSLLSYTRRRRILERYNYNNNKRKNNVRNHHHHHQYLFVIILILCGKSRIIYGQNSTNDDNNNTNNNATTIVDPIPMLTTTPPSPSPVLYNNNDTTIIPTSLQPIATTTTTVQPTSYNPSYLSTLPPSPIPEPTVRVIPTDPPTQSSYPTLYPSSSLIPTMFPSTSSAPTVSSQPSTYPTPNPSNLPTIIPSEIPSQAPTISSEPSTYPSWIPSTYPSLSFQPSPFPTNSHAPSISAVPTQYPTDMPTKSAVPTPIASNAPSIMPTIPPTTLAPTPFPTPALNKVTQPLLEMTLLGMDNNVATTDVTLGLWRRTTSQHVQQYWKSFNSSSPFYIGRVVTQLIAETRLSQRQRFRRYLQPGYPDPLVLTYSQEVNFLLKNNTTEPFPGYMESDVFTIPFFQDGTSYTEQLRLVFNNSNIIFLEYTGIIDEPTTSKRDRNVIAITVTVVALSLVIASAYIVYLTRFKEHNQNAGHEVSAHAQPIGAVIGVNSSDNVLISESYDEEYVTSPNIMQQTDYNNNNMPGGSTRKMDSNVITPPPTGNAFHHTRTSTPTGAIHARTISEARSYPGETSTGIPPTVGGGGTPSREHSAPSDFALRGNFPTLSGTHLSVQSDISGGIEGGGQHIQRPSNTYSPLQSFQGSTASVDSNHESDYLISTGTHTPVIPQDESFNTDDDDENNNMNNSDNEENNNKEEEESESPNVPFMSGFQMQIQDLE